MRYQPLSELFSRNHFGHNVQVNNNDAQAKVTRRIVRWADAKATVRVSPSKFTIPRIVPACNRK